MRKEHWIILLLSVITGFLVGALLLHPVSRLLLNIQTNGQLGMIQIISDSFSGRHFIMGAYFSLLGGVLGAIVGLLIRNVMKKYEASMELYRTLLDSNNRFIVRIREREQDSSNLAKAILPSLVKIKKDVENLPGNNSGISKEKQVQFVVRQNVESILSLLVTIIENGEGNGRDETL